MNETDKIDETSGLPDLDVDFSAGNDHERELLGRLIRLNSETAAGAPSTPDATPSADVTPLSDTAPLSDMAQSDAIPLSDADLGMLAAAGDVLSEQGEGHIPGVDDADRERTDPRR